MNLSPSSPGTLPDAEVSEAYAVDVAADVLDRLRQRIGVTITQAEFDHLHASGGSFSHTSALNAHAEAKVAYAKKQPTFRKFYPLLSRIFEPLDHFKAALDILSQASGAPGLLIWGSIRIVLQVRIAALCHRSTGKSAH